LRALRIKKGLTQEQLAEIFSVSPQAISRWENSSASPDISLLPGIAIFYRISLDELMGMEEIRSKERIGKIHAEAHRLVAAGKIDQAVQVFREGLKLYPNHPALLLSLSETLAHQYDDPACVDEAITLSERALRHADLSMKARSTACANLLFLYAQAHMQEKIPPLIQSLPHIWESREMLFPEQFEGQEYSAALQEAVQKALVYLCRRIDALPERIHGKAPDYIQLGVNFSPEESLEQMLDKIKSFCNSPD